MAKLKFYRGDTVNINLTFTGVDLTGATVFMTAKTNVEDTDEAAAISKTVTSHLDAASGQTRIALSPTDTDVTPGKYGYDIQLKTASGDVSTVEVGTVQVIADYTRRTS